MTITSINYSNTIIYKIQHNDKDELIYVGHTTDFTTRKSSHKRITQSENDKSYNRQLYKMIRDNGGWVSFKMIEIKTFSCTNKREAEAEEDKVMRELKATMNKNRAFRTAEDVKEDARIYRENLNKDENGNRTIDAYLEKLRKQKIHRDAYKERQKNKELAKLTQ